MTELLADVNGAEDADLDADVALADDDSIVEDDETPARPSGLLAYANWAITRGWDPIPLWGVCPDGVCACEKGAACKSAGKHPVQDGWQSRERMTKPEAWEWFANTSHPVNIGLRTGECSGFFVVDIDPDNDGDKFLAALEAEHGALPETQTHQTGSGGRHYLFALPSDFKVSNSRGDLPRGIDIRGEGGLIVAPGSVSGKGPYRTERAVDSLLAAPEWLLNSIRPKDYSEIALTEGDGVAYADLSAEKQAAADKYLRAAIDPEIARLDAMREAATTDGSYRGEPWDQTTYDVACVLLEFAQSPWANYTAYDVRRDLREHAPTDRGFTAADVLSKMVSAARKVRGKARPAPDAVTAPSWDEMTAGVPTQRPRRSGWDEADIGGEMRDRMAGDVEDDELWITHKNGTKSLDIPEAARRVMAADGGAMLADISGGLWVYRDGAFILDSRHVGRALDDILGRRWNPAHVSNVEKYIRTTGELLDFNEVAHPSLVNFRNGMVEWRTGDLTNHDPAYRSTFQVNADWDPVAACPLFSHYVDTMLEPDAATLLWQVIGYSMLPGNPMQVFVFFEGSGGNGKGVVQRALVSLLSPGNVSSLSMAEIDGENRFKLSRMVGRAANISGETPRTHIGDSSNLKNVTGGDWVDVERKGVDGVQVRIHALPIFSVNEVPSLGDDSEGLFQRAVVIPFHRSSSDHPIPNFDEAVFRTELAGIARRGIEAVRAVRFDSPTLRANGFTLGSAGHRARRDFREQANAELDWVNNHLRPADDYWMTPTELYRAYGGRMQRPTRKFMRALRERLGEPVTATPTSLTNWGGQARPAKNNRVNCYGVRVSEDRIDPVREIFGVRSEEAS